MTMATRRSALRGHIRNIPYEIAVTHLTIDYIQFTEDTMISEPRGKGHSYCFSQIKLIFHFPVAVSGPRGGAVT